MKKTVKTEKNINVENSTPLKSIDGFSANFLDEEICRKFVLNFLHPCGAHCPHCEIEITDNTTLKNFWINNRCNCKKCNKGFTALTGSFLFKSRLNFKEIITMALIIEMSETKFKLKDIAGLLDVSTDTVHNWIKKFKHFNFKVITK